MKYIVAIILITVAYFSIEEYLSYRVTPKSMTLNINHNPSLNKGDCLEFSLKDSKTSEKRYILIKGFIKESREYRTVLYSPVNNKYIDTELNVDAVDAEKMIKVIKCP